MDSTAFVVYKAFRISGGVVEDGIRVAHFARHFRPMIGKRSSQRLECLERLFGRLRGRSLIDRPASPTQRPRRSLLTSSVRARAT